MAEELEKQISFCNMEAGPNLQFIADLGVSGLPTFLYYMNGELKGSLAGTNILMEEIVSEAKSLLA